MSDVAFSGSLEATRTLKVSVDSDGSQWVKGINLPVSDSNVIVFSVPGVLKREQREGLNSVIDASFPDQRTLVLEAGVTATILDGDERLVRIEAKLDALIAALAEDAEDDEADPKLTLDGFPSSLSERDTNQPL